MYSPMTTLAAVAALSNSSSQASVMSKETRRYPEWRSRRKTRGQRDASMRSRSNRRKAQR